MSRGRKKKELEFNFDWLEFFQINEGNYLELLSKIPDLERKIKKVSNEELLKQIQKEKEAILTSKKLRLNTSKPKEDILKLRYNIPENWNWFLLSDVAFYQEGPGIRSFQYRTEGIKLLNVQNITQDQLRLDLTTRYIAIDEYNLKYKHFKIDFGDILFASSGGSWGKSCFYEEKQNELILNTSTMRLRSFSEKILLNKYLYLFIKTNFFKNQLIPQLMGMQPNFGSTHFNSISIPLPPVDVQKRILEFFDSIKNNTIQAYGTFLEKKVEQKIIQLHNSQINCFQINSELQHQSDLVKKLRQSILQDAVQGKLNVIAITPEREKQSQTTQKIASGKALAITEDEDAHKLLQKIKAEKQKLIAEGKLKKEKELPPISPDDIPFELPKNWAWCRLGEISSVGTGGTPLTSKKEYYEGNIPWITSSATGDLFVNEAESYISEQAIKETNCKIYPIGTLIVAMYGQGKTRGQITELNINAATNQACAAIELVIKNEAHKKYTKLFFQKIYLEIRELASGGAQPNLNLQKIKDTLYPLPPLSEQERIVAKVEELMLTCDALEKEVEQSKTQLQHLMQNVLREAFEGS